MSTGNNTLIAIMSNDKKNIIGCYSVKSSKILGSKKYVLNAVDGISFWGENTVMLGMYNSE